MSSDIIDPSRKRKRAAHACDICRSRKIRCDGAQPCATCAASDQECAYGGDGNSRGKSDLILETVLRMESFLHGMTSMIHTPQSLGNGGGGGGGVSREFSAQHLDSPQTTFSGTTGDSPQGVVVNGGMGGTGGSSTPQNIHNAVLASLHTSTTESVLQWPHFDVFPSLRQAYISIFQLEQSRVAIAEKSAAMHPYLNVAEIDQIVEAFEDNINFWYPTLSRGKILGARARIVAGDVDCSTSSSLACLMMSLGCASQSVSAIAMRSEPDPEDLDYQRSRRAMADMYMDGVLKKLHVAHMEMSSTAAHCLFFTALYFAFQQRPLQAWEYINATAAKCRLLLSYPPKNENNEDQECLRRIFWSCYILESDYLAELAALPQSGISSIESSIPLPGPFMTHPSSTQQELSSLYFLACISMRRLLNRVHHLLYSANNRIALSTARFPVLVSELDHQLEEWRLFLPPAFRFSLDSNEAETQHGGFLRQRYLTCRSVIYRPYLTWVLTHYTEMETGAAPENVLEKGKVCLDACLLHILNLRGFAHTIMVDTWICSLSMTGAMLILLAACRLPTLRALVGPEVVRAGAHLRRLIRRWEASPKSPSVEQSLRMIGEIEGFIKKEYEGQLGGEEPGRLPSIADFRRSVGQKF